MNWEVIKWTCITISVLLCVTALVLSIISARNMKKRREEMADLQKRIRVGAKVLFAGGIYGKITKVKDDVIDVEVAKGMIVQISRYSIQSAE